jgi:chitin disaccharide deacetylase
MTLAERLGYDADARILIVRAAGLGLCHAANVGVFESLHTPAVTTSALMVPCPWSRHAATAYRGEDIGVELTLNAEWDAYRWAPITHAPSLLDGDGGFPRTVEDMWDHADLDEVRRECRAQIERAILWGFDVSHLDAHLDALQMRPEYFDVYLDMALEFALPVRIDGPVGPDQLGFPARQVAEDAGVVFVDRVVPMPRAGLRESLEAWVAGLEPGVSELRLHPAVDTPELRAVAPDWAARVGDWRLACEGTGLKEALDAAGVALVGYLPLRRLARGS